MVRNTGFAPALAQKGGYLGQTHLLSASHVDEAFTRDSHSLGAKAAPTSRGAHTSHGFRARVTFPAEHRRSRCNSIITASYF